MNKTSGWYGVDLDGTLATWAGWVAPDAIGEPIPAMVDRVKRWLADGREVRIMTARVSSAHDPAEVQVCRHAIIAWCVKHLGRSLAVTAEKDNHMIELWDDRSVRVERNTGRQMSPSEDVSCTPMMWAVIRQLEDALAAAYAAGPGCKVPGRGDG